MTAMTIPKIIPPTNEAPSNFLPVVCLEGTVDVGEDEVMLVAVDTEVAGVVAVGDILVAAEVFVAFEISVVVGVVVGVVV